VSSIAARLVANIDIEAKHFALGVFWIEHFARSDGLTEIKLRQKRGTENQRAAMCNAGFNNKSGLICQISSCKATSLVDTG